MAWGISEFVDESDLALFEVDRLSNVMNLGIEQMP